jgi:ADP-heptose:LPS heptosyltransferase
VKTILVFRIGQLGDTLESVPAVRAIRAAHPEDALVLLTDRHAASGAVTAWDVLGATGLFAGVRYLPIPATPLDYLALAKQIRRLAPHRLYYLPPMPRTRWQVERDRFFFRYICGISDIVGLRATGTYPVRDREGKLVRLEKESARLLAWIAADLPRVPTDLIDAGLQPDDKERLRAKSIVEGAGFSGCRLIAFGPGSKMQAKTWPEDRYETVGRELLREDPNVRLVVLGAALERPIGDRLCSEWGPRSLNVAGQLTIGESAALLERCCVYVGNDTGTMHLAASVGTTCVAIFSARDNPGKWEPRGARHAVLRHDVPCAGCMLETCIERGRACLVAIEPPEVLAAARSVINRAAEAGDHAYRQGGSGDGSAREAIGA